MTKEDLAEQVLTKEELNKIDFALPQKWVDNMTENLVDPRDYYVWYYGNDKIGGEPLNLAERYFENLLRDYEL